MNFRNAKSAIIWAENRLNRSQVKSSLSSLQKQTQSGTGDLSASELDDIAQTVTHISQNILRPKGPAMLAIYGLDTPSRDWNLADVMVLFLKQLKHPSLSLAMNTLNDKQLKTFMLCVIKDVRNEEMCKNHMPKAHYYELCNLNAHKWKKYELYNLRGMAQTMLQLWIEDAAKQLELELDSINLLS